MYEWQIMAFMKGRCKFWATNSFLLHAKRNFVESDFQGMFSWNFQTLEILDGSKREHYPVMNINYWDGGSRMSIRYCDGGSSDEHPTLWRGEPNDEDPSTIYSDTKAQSDILVYSWIKRLKPPGFYRSLLQISRRNKKEWESSDLPT